MIDTHLVGYASSMGGTDPHAAMSSLVIEKALAENATFAYQWLRPYLPHPRPPSSRLLAPIAGDQAI